jgi:hypothetical protein
VPCLAVPGPGRAVPPIWPSLAEGCKDKEKGKLLVGCIMAVNLNDRTGRKDINLDGHDWAVWHVNAIVCAQVGTQN